MFKEIRLVCPVCFVHASESPQDMYVNHLMTCERCMNTVWQSNLQSVVLRLAGKFKVWETWWDRAVWWQGGATYLCCTLQQRLPTFLTRVSSVCAVKPKLIFTKKQILEKVRCNKYISLCDRYVYGFSNHVTSKIYPEILLQGLKTIYSISFFCQISSFKVLHTDTSVLTLSSRLEVCLQAVEWSSAYTCDGGLFLCGWCSWR